jgi:acetolactate synthase-1/2/3 large subunit
MGAAVVALPYDVMAATTVAPILGRVEAPSAGAATPDAVERAAARIAEATFPVVLLGGRSAEPDAVEALRRLLEATDLPVVETFQSAGAISRALLDRFCGRVGLFRNQPGDVLLADADVIVAVGFDPVEYDPELWNVARTAGIIHIDELPATLDAHYQPEVELVGGIAATLAALSAHASGWRLTPSARTTVTAIRARLDETPVMPASATVVHPATIVSTLRDLLPDDAIVACDIGSSYVWMARHFRTFEPRRLLFSNGQQTLGVALPWAIAASLVEPGRKVISVSGDGGFGFSAIELETAVRLQSELVHLVWCDGSYNMVAAQEVLKYGRSSGTDLGPIDFVLFAQSFGATGMLVTTTDELRPTLQRALTTPGPVVVEIAVDYSDNLQLFAEVHDDVLD